MKYIINGGIYEVDLSGTNDAEFNGSHPSLIMRSIKNEDMYYIIPFTTYTKERWEKYRKNLCCRVLSSNSIARIDKMQLRHTSKIPKRWLEGNSFIILPPDEIEDVHNHVQKYLKLSADNSVKEYKKYYSNYTEFSQKVTNLFVDYKFESNTTFNFTIDSNNILCTCDLSNISQLTFDDAKRIIWSVFDRGTSSIRYDGSVLKISISLNDKRALTFKEEYEKINSTEGQ